jgi:hypothetical protein
MKIALYYAIMILSILIGAALALCADTVEMKNGYEIEAPIVLDKHGYFGEADETPEAVPVGKVRLKFENGYTDIPKDNIKTIRRAEGE